MVWSVNDATFDVNNNIPDYLITVSFAVPGAPSEFLWGTARCANDVVHSPAPIPGTLLLLGSALISLAGAGLRKKKLV